MLASMAKSKKKPASEKVIAEPVSARLEPELLAALDSFCASQEFPPSRSTVIARALMELLEKKAFWPPKSDVKK